MPWSRNRQYDIGRTLVKRLPLVGHGFTGLGGPRALVATQVHSGDGVDVLLAGLDVLVAKRRYLHQLLIQLLRSSTPRTAEDVVTGQIVLQVWSPVEIDKRPLSHAGEDSLQANRLCRRIDVAGEYLDRLRALARNKGVRAARLHLGLRCDAILVFQLPFERLVQIRTLSRGRGIAHNDIGSAANRSALDLISKG